MNKKPAFTRAFFLLVWLLVACTAQKTPSAPTPSPTHLPTTTRAQPTSTSTATATAQAPSAGPCDETVTPPAPFGSLEAVPLDFAQAGYAAEWFVAPGAFNMPQEVMVTPQGELLILSVRSGILSRVDEGGAVTQFARDVRGYLGGVDAQGNLYLHWHPSGVVTRVAPTGAMTVVVQSPELQAPCDSGFGIGPDGNMYLAHNQCTNTADLIQITPAGKITKVARSIPWMNALRATPDGRLLGAGYDIYEISLEDFSVKVLAPTPSRNLSAGGMAVDEEGNIYISNGNRSPRGEIYRLTPAGGATLLAKIPGNGLSGIEWWPKTGEIVGGQLRQGGLIAVSMDGSLRTLVPGNGIVTPMGMAFSPCGDLAVANDDGGMMTLVNPAGQVSWFFDYPSFTPPTPFVAYASDGTLFASVGAPGMPEEILTVAPGGAPRTLVKSAMPCGLAYQENGALFVAESSTGRIVKIDPNGTKTVFVEGLKFPQDLRMDAEGNLYVITGPADFTGDAVFKTPQYGDIILRISPDGSVSTFAHLQWATALAVSPTGELFAAAGSKVMHVAADGTASLLVSGLHHIRGLAFDLAGNLYVADADLNGILRIGGFPQGTIGGVVTDASGNPVAGARLQVLSVHPSVAGQMVTTDAEGRFELPAATNVYTLVASTDGFSAAALEGIQVLAGQATALQIELTK